MNTAAIPRKPRGCITNLEQMRQRCAVDPMTHCWIWLGGENSDGVPCLRTIDYATTEKRVMGGPLAAWHIAHNKPPLPGYVVYRCCGNKRCLNPAHLREVSRPEMFAAIARSGRLKGLHSPRRLESLAKAREARGTKPLPDEAVLEIRAAPPELTNVALAARLGCHHSTVAKIRLRLRLGAVV